MLSGSQFHFARWGHPIVMVGYLNSLHSTVWFPATVFDCKYTCTDHAYIGMACNCHFCPRSDQICIRLQFVASKLCTIAPTTVPLHLSWRTHFGISASKVQKDHLDMGFANPVSINRNIHEQAHRAHTALMCACVISYPTLLSCHHLSTISIKVIIVVIIIIIISSSSSSRSSTKISWSQNLNIASPSTLQTPHIILQMTSAALMAFRTEGLLSWSCWA